MTSVIRLTDIPDGLLACISDSTKKKCYLNGKVINEIFIFRNNEYRINTSKGQYRYPLNTDATIEVY